jgi:tetratricopeptide (TPR) repeat protein
MPSGLLVKRVREMKEMDTPQTLLHSMNEAYGLEPEIRYQETALRLATENEPESATAWKALGDFYNERLHYPLAIDAYLAARERSLGKAWLDVAEFVTFEMVYMNLVLRDYDASLEESAYYLAAFPESAKLDQAYLYRGYAFFYKKAYDEARAVLEEQIRKFPNSPHNGNAQEIINASTRAAR